MPWWYRSDFTVTDTSERSYLDFSGVISAADVYVNGHRVAKTADVAGSYTHHELDITSLVRAGTNTVAFRVQPNTPNKKLTMGWIDWLQPPPDENMGIVRDVLVRRGGLGRAARRTRGDQARRPVARLGGPDGQGAGAQ